MGCQKIWVKIFPPRTIDNSNASLICLPNLECATYWSFGIKSIAKMRRKCQMYKTDHRVWRLLHVTMSILLFIFYLFYVSNKNRNWVETHQVQLGFLCDTNHHSYMSIHLYQTRRPSSDFWEWIFYSHNGIKSITIILASWEQLLNEWINSPFHLRATFIFASSLQPSWGRSKAYKYCLGPIS